jgi:outer membrane immunogenic protein
MSRVLVAAAAGLMAMTSVTNAAPANKAATVIPRWSGWYVGGNVGYGWSGTTGSSIELTDPQLVFAGYAALGGFRFPSVSPTGAIGGGQIGYNLQTGSVVWGIVTDFQFSDMKASAVVGVPALTGGTVFGAETQSHSAKIEWVGTLRGRIGYAFSNLLPYVSGGLAYGRVSSTLNLLVDPAFSGFAMAGQSATTKTGWTIGAGFEYALPGNWSFGLDYLYVDLGHDTVSATPQNFLQNTSGTVIAINQRFTSNILRATVNYKF